MVISFQSTVYVYNKVRYIRITDKVRYTRNTDFVYNGQKTLVPTGTLYARFTVLLLLLLLLLLLGPNDSTTTTTTKTRPPPPPVPPQICENALSIEFVYLKIKVVKNEYYYYLKKNKRMIDMS